MIKKLLVLGMFLFSSHSMLIAQTQAPTTPTVVTDTLSYFYNKQLFKIPNPFGVGFPYYKSAAATVTNITHMGSIFLNNDPNLMVDGLFARMAYQDNSNALSIPVRLFLCNLTIQNGTLTPVFPPVDSVNVSVGALQLASLSNTGYAVGGTFTVSHNMPGNFAVLVRNLSTLSGDTVRLYRTSAVTPTNWPHYTPTTNHGEGLGLIRDNKVFYRTTNYPNTNFGYGSDYEFCVAPVVTYTLFADHITPPKVNSDPADSVYCWEPLTFTNTSSPEWTSRFFNLNEFYRHFYPYVNTPVGGFPVDSAISWYFDDEDFDNPLLRPNIFLKKDSIRATKYYDSTGCFTSCSMRARLRKMIAGGNGMDIRGNIEFSVCVSNYDCDKTTGINENAQLNGIKLFPNPSANGIVTISGLQGKNTIQIYDMLGSLKATLVSTEEEVLVDLLKVPGGTYLIKVTNEQQKYRSIKVVHQNE